MLLEGQPCFENTMIIILIIQVSIFIYSRTQLSIHIFLISFIMKQSCQLSHIFQTLCHVISKYMKTVSRHFDKKNITFLNNLYYFIYIQCENHNVSYMAKIMILLKSLLSKKQMISGCVLLRKIMLAYYDVIILMFD